MNANLLFDFNVKTRKIRQIKVQRVCRWIGPGLEYCGQLQIQVLELVVGTEALFALKRKFIFRKMGFGIIQC